MNRVIDSKIIQIRRKGVSLTLTDRDHDRSGNQKLGFNPTYKLQELVMGWLIVVSKGSGGHS
jgi:hypothetical protein